MLSRRNLLGLLGASLCFNGEEAWALSRTPHGGTLRISLPISTTRIDPHDPHDLSAALLGSSLFEPLYQELVPGGVVFPTLAAELPKRRARGVSIELRSDLRSASGQSLDARVVAGSLSRAQKGLPQMRALGRISTLGPRVLLETSLSTKAVAQLLSAPTSAIVPSGFTPHHPSGTGALFAIRTGLSVLARNPWSPRGGSYLDAVQLRTEDLRLCLRSFEKGSSHVALLGQGLHQNGKRGASFSLGIVGSLLLLPGKRLSTFTRAGVLTGELARTPSAGLKALGVQPVLSGPQGKYRGPPLVIDVDAAQPWLFAIAEELARVWNSPQAPIEARGSSAQELASRRRSGDFDAQLLFHREIDPVALNSVLFAMDGTPPPRSPSKTTLEWTARRLRLGFLGFLKAFGVMSPAVEGADSKGRFALENTFFTPPFD